MPCSRMPACTAVNGSSSRHRRFSPSATWTSVSFVRRLDIMTAQQGDIDDAVQPSSSPLGPAERPASISNMKDLTSIAAVRQTKRRVSETDTCCPRTPPLGKAALLHIPQPVYPSSQGSCAADVPGDVNVSDPSLFFIVQSKGSKMVSGRERLSKDGRMR